MKNILTLLLLCAIGVATQAQTSDTIKVIGLNQKTIVRFDKPLCFLDGKKFSVDSLHVINPNSIESIHIVKGPEAEMKYGGEGKNGVVIITRKEIVKKEED